VSQSFYLVLEVETELNSQCQKEVKEEQEILTEPQNDIPPPCPELTKSTSLSEAPAIKSKSTEEGVSSVTTPLGEDVDMDAREEERLPFLPQEDVVEDALEEKKLSSPLEKDMEMNAREEV
jgi:hypothetical protein